MSIEDQLEYMSTMLKRIARSLETIALAQSRMVPDPMPKEIDEQSDPILKVGDEMQPRGIIAKAAGGMDGQSEAVQEQEVEEPGDKPGGDSHRQVYEEAERPLGEREREIISLSRRMGIEYLVHDGTVVVDSAVMDEYRRLKET